jgi:hypothetical protein
MSHRQKKWLGAQFMDAVGRGLGKLLDFGLTAGPDLYKPSPWKDAAVAHNDTPTETLIADADRDKVIHLHEYYKIADALSWEIGKYFISRRDTATFLMPFSSDLSFKAGRGEIESWLRTDFMENRRDIHYVRVGDLMDHIAENPLPGDNWHVKTLGKGVLFSGELKNRPLQIRKLMVLSAELATDQRATIAANPDKFIHKAPGAPVPPVQPDGPRAEGP